jgi:hypothetical protein
MDALPPQDLIAPIVLVAGLAYDAGAAAEARRLAPTVDDSLLNRAARCGLYDPEIAAIATDLAQIALRGARALGDEVVCPGDVERAGELIVSRLRAAV